MSGGKSMWYNIDGTTEQSDTWKYFGEGKARTQEAQAGQENRRAGRNTLWQESKKSLNRK
eukprot:5119735-Pleurochrysis_carterae.AAC.1